MKLFARTFKITKSLMIYCKKWVKGLTRATVSTNFYVGASWVAPWERTSIMPPCTSTVPSRRKNLAETTQRVKKRAGSPLAAQQAKEGLLAFREGRVTKPLSLEDLPLAKED